VALAVVAVAIGLPLWRGMPRLHSPQDTEIAAHEYGAEPGSCEPQSRPGPGGASSAEETEKHVRYLVKTPSNYDPTRAHPLIVVYAPHGANRYLSERYVGLTREATRAGFVIAYADSRPLDRQTIADLATIPERVAARWCIDPKRIFFTGHSDGATVATAITVGQQSQHPPAAIAPSAAGFRGEDLATFACPPPVAVMVLANRDDELFPGYGREAARWWAACNGCGATPQARADGCLEYTDCAPGGTTLYCESPGRHVVWPERNAAMLEFFRNASR
jgi:polyhydroxybutyrate depolymerase